MSTLIALAQADENDGFLAVAAQKADIELADILSRIANEADPGVLEVRCALDSIERLSCVPEINRALEAIERLSL